MLNGDYLHIHFCAHILNLIVTKRLKELEPSIVSVRNAVKDVRSSPPGCKHFKFVCNKRRLIVEEVYFGLSY